MAPKVKKRSIFVDGYKSSISMEDEFWISLKEIAQKRHMGRRELVAEIKALKEHPNLCSAIRVYVLNYYMQTGGSRS